MEFSWPPLPHRSSWMAPGRRAAHLQQDVYVWVEARLRGKRDAVWVFTAQAELCRHEINVSAFKMDSTCRLDGVRGRAVELHLLKQRRPLLVDKEGSACWRSDSRDSGASLEGPMP